MDTIEGLCCSLGIKVNCPATHCCAKTDCRFDVVWSDECDYCKSTFDSDCLNYDTVQQSKLCDSCNGLVGAASEAPVEADFFVNTAGGSLLAPIVSSLTG
jgi:hypothetical protein